MAGFNPDGTRRVQRTVQAYENKTKPRGPVARGPRIVLPPRNGYTTSTISARSGLQRGVGTCRLVIDDGSGKYRDRSSADTIAISNPYSTAIPSGYYVTLHYVDGGYQIVGADCAASAAPTITPTVPPPSKPGSTNAIHFAAGYFASGYYANGYL